MAESTYCAICGNTGIDMEGNPCTCRPHLETLYQETAFLDIPEQYRGSVFNSSLINQDMHESYRRFMQDFYESIISLKVKCKNTIICSPPSRGKTMLAYCCVEKLFRLNISTFPVYDVLEIKRMMHDMDFNRKSLYEISEPMRLLTCPYLFVKVPATTNFDVYDTMYQIIDRRVRRGGSTIFLYNGSWETLILNDGRGTIKSLLGDGSYTTLENKTWRSQSE